MPDTPFQTRQPNIEQNPKIREPQKRAFAKLQEFASDKSADREVGVVLPVGCGKSGCIALAPFAFLSERTLVIAPGLNIAEQLEKDFNPSQSRTYFYTKCDVLKGGPYPEPAPIRGTTTNRGDLDDAHVVITNIQQLQGVSNPWLTSLPADYFDLILFDEGHHSVATTWEQLKNKFPAAKIVNFSATPLRADGQKMAGDIIYSYPIFDAIAAGYVKTLRALVLEPTTLKYVREEDGAEIEVTLEEVVKLGEEESDFRRSIVTSKETLDTIVDVSIRELENLRTKTGENRLKIIASALNFAHCHQIVSAYRARGFRVDFVHSKEDTVANAKVMKRLENHELDVIVQVKKLGEGFDHPYLSVAAVFSVFGSLSPFVQFVGRIMRVIKQDAPGDPLNGGVVVFHAGANIARRWKDFQQYSGADQGYFDQLLPMTGLSFTNASEVSIEPRPTRAPNTVEVREQSDVVIDEIPLVANTPKAQQLIDELLRLGVSPDDVSDTMKRKLEPVPTTKVNERKALRAELDNKIKTEASRILAERGISNNGMELDTSRRNLTNFVVLKSAIDREVNNVADHGTKKRHELLRPELDAIYAQFNTLVAAAVAEVFK